STWLSPPACGRRCRAWLGGRRGSRHRDAIDASRGLAVDLPLPQISKHLGASPLPRIAASPAAARRNEKPVTRLNENALLADGLAGTSGGDKRQHGGLRCPAALASPGGEGRIGLLAVEDDVAGVEKLILSADAEPAAMRASAGGILGKLGPENAD